MSTSAIVKSYTEARKDLDRIAAQRKLIAAKNRVTHDEMANTSRRSLQSPQNIPQNMQNILQNVPTFSATAPFFSPEQYNPQVITNIDNAWLLPGVGNTHCTMDRRP